VADRYHLDTDFLVYALSVRGPERERLEGIASSDAVLEMSALAWYAFCRGPRTEEQVAVARTLFGEDGVVALTESFAVSAAEQFRKLGSPRRRAADVAIGVMARECRATLLTRNARDFRGIDGLVVDVVSGGPDR
jgi:predicted nucleic acid-binding protein